MSNALKWTIMGVAALGFLFDIYEVLMGPLIVQPALLELGNLHPGTPEYRDWASYLFWGPPLVGGFFGLWGGYLTDWFGRRRVLVWSILLYSVSALIAAQASTLPELLCWRMSAFAGACVEYVAAIAWLAELFTEPKQREKVIGYTQVFSSFGGVLASVAFYLSNRYGAILPAVAGGHSAWRYTLISGMIPALPLILIRPFLPESPEWHQKKLAGTLKRPSILELFHPQFRRTTIVSALLFACAYAGTFGTIQQAPQIAPGLPEVASLTGAARGQAISSVQFMQEVGGLAGRLAMAVLALYVVSRRNLLRIFLVPGLAIMPLVFGYAAQHSMFQFQVGMLFGGFIVVAQINFWGLYLPRVYPVHLRGTGEGFAANVGGRMLGTSASYITTHLAAVMPGAAPPNKLAYAAAVVGTCIFALAVTLTFFLPEPPDKSPE